MQDAIRQFRDSYADLFASGMSRFLGLHGQTVIQQLQTSITTPRSTVYLFGNGGSHAIGKCLEYALQSYASSVRQPLRVVTGVDVHKVAHLTPGAPPGTSFLRVLETEGANSGDLVVLITGSGDSDNLCEVAKHTARLAIPTLALIGSAKGKLQDFVPASRCFFVPVEDQQISEDIIQSLAYFLNRPAAGTAHADWIRCVVSRAEELRHVIRQIPESFIDRIAEALVDAFCHRKYVWVLGFDHPALSVSAEHTAHNLYWDGVYEVDDPPQRLIFSTPTACDFSGISNDRRKGVVENLTGVCEADGQSIMLLYSMSMEHPALYQLLDRLDQLDIPVFLLTADRHINQRCRRMVVHNTELKEPQIQAGVSQILGHILGRIVRMKLIERRDTQDRRLLSDPARFLITFDLAQRRLLDG